MSTTVWLILFVAFVVLEAVTYQMISTWFAIGAVFSALSSSLGAGVGLQIGVFLVVSAVCLMALRPFAFKLLKVKKEKTNADALLGQYVVITEDADSVNGKGRIQGMEWSVRSEDGDLIKVGDKAVVKKISGVKLIVSKGE